MSRGMKRVLKKEMFTAHREFTNPKWKTAVIELQYIDNNYAKEEGAGKQELFKEVKLLLKTQLKTF